MLMFQLLFLPQTQPFFERFVFSVSLFVSGIRGVYEILIDGLALLLPESMKPKETHVSAASRSEPTPNNDTRMFSNMNVVWCLDYQLLAERFEDFRAVEVSFVCLYIEVNFCVVI